MKKKMSSTKKPEKLKDDSVFSKNNNHRIKYRKRVQEDKEKLQEVKEYNAGTEIQDTIRRDDFQD